MKNKIARTRKFVSDHRVAIAVVATASVGIALQMRNAREWNEFLKEHNLFDEYYDMSWDVEPAA